MNQSKLISISIFVLLFSLSACKKDSSIDDDSPDQDPGEFSAEINGIKWESGGVLTIVTEYAHYFSSSASLRIEGYNAHEGSLFDNTEIYMEVYGIYDGFNDTVFFHPGSVNRALFNGVNEKYTTDTIASGYISITQLDLPGSARAFSAEFEFTAYSTAKDSLITISKGIISKIRITQVG